MQNKSNASDVATALNAKANKTYVDLQLGQKASFGYVDDEAFEDIAGVVNTAPLALETLRELAAVLSNESNFANTVQTQFSYKADKSKTHTRTETNDFLNVKADKTDMDLKATAPSVYTKSEVNTFLSQKAAVSD